MIDEWEIGKLILIYKKGDKLKPENYIPLTMISHINKLFFKIILNRIRNDLESLLNKE